MNFSAPHRSHAEDRFARFQDGLDASVALCIGLVPVFHLVALQLVLVLILGSVLLRGRQMFSNAPRLGWTHLLILQFALYFTLNALLYPSLEGNMRHLQRVALESWGMTLLGFGIIWLYLARGQDFFKAMQRWTPIGLVISFVVMSYFFFGPQGNRAQAYSTNALNPPMWFLTLVLICFCNFHLMSKPAQLLRIALLVAASVMCLYSGGRMILFIWVLTTVCLGGFLVITRPSRTRAMLDLLILAFGLVTILALLIGLDAVTGRTIAIRFMYTVNKISENGFSSQVFLRLELWEAALQIIRNHLPFGAGQVNERLLIHEIVNREWWFRAHQTYLSYLIAGGWIALISGILLQGAALSFFARSMVPAGLGLFVVPSLNGLTDSVFQSFFSVQFYMLLVFLLAKNSNTLHNA